MPERELYTVTTDDRQTITVWSRLPRMMQFPGEHRFRWSCTCGKGARTLYQGDIRDEALCAIQGASEHAVDYHAAPRVLAALSLG